MQFWLMVYIMSSGEQQDVRCAAESLYRNVQQPGPSRYARSSQNAHLDLLSFVHEDYIAGYTQDGQMSTVRRFFCLFVMFDLFFISMLWFICIMMHGETFVNALKEQVLNYTIQKSLFDIILAAFVRFTLLLTFYGVFAINHWCIITLTTTTSCAFLIGKVFYYDWIEPVQPIIQVLMIIVSCLLAWGEAWFLDCRVIPQEKNAQRFYRLMMAQTHDNERSPLLESYLNSYHNSGQTDATGSVANYYSPLESEHNSDIDDDITDENEMYKRKGFDDVQATLELMQCIDWKLEKIVTSTGDRIQSIQRKKIGKIYRLTAQINLSASELFRRLYNGMEDVPSWNPTVLEARVLRKIDDHTDITYSVSAAVAGGLVDSRDFVDLRHWQLMINGHFVDDKVLENDQLNAMNERQAKSNPNSESTMQKASSEMNLIDMDQSALDQSISSLSKSLGAGVFSDVEPKTSSPEMYNSKTSDEFVDATESQDIQSTTESSNRSEEAEHIQDIVNDLCDKMYIVSGTSIKFDGMPETKYVRAENLISCWATRQSKTNPNVCTLDFLLCLDLKGRFPRFVLDKAYTNVMQEFMSHLRKYCESIEANV